MDVNLELILRLILATVFGWLIGLEREIVGKTAGTRTFALVALGSAFFGLISSYGFKEFIGLPGVDPTRVASQVLLGIGFIGAGLIIFREGKIEGLTTAATLWTTAALGLALGRGLYFLSIVVFALILIILLSVRWIHPEEWKRALEEHKKTQ